MTITNSQLLANKQEFIHLLKQSNRPGINDLIGWLETKTDFFTAPASTSFHSAFSGGLCLHSLNVYKMLKEQLEIAKRNADVSKQIENIGEDTLIIVALLHDICKVNFYKQVVKTWHDDTAPIGNQWRKYYGYVCEDSLPLGHGEKSVILIQNFIRLSCTEMLAIRWHMANSDPGTYLSIYEKPSLLKTCNDCPLATVLQVSDYLASHIMEDCTDIKIANEIV